MSPYIEVDFQELKYLSGVVTQGEGQEEKWVTEYKVYTSVDGVNFIPYSENQDGVVKIFPGNTDSDTPAANFFVKNILAQYVRIIPVNSHSSVALRYEINFIKVNLLNIFINVISLY